LFSSLTELARPASCTRAIRAVDKEGQAASVWSPLPLSVDERQQAHPSGVSESSRHIGFRNSENRENEEDLSSCSAATMSVKPPAAVREAIRNFQTRGIFTLKPASASERSVIFHWGVRVEFIDDEKTHTAWICLADDHCRRSSSFFLLSSGRTSKATKHLKDKHNVLSEKSVVESQRKRGLDQDIERLSTCSLVVNDPQRLHLLLETLRVVNNNLPLRFGEFLESKLINEIVVKEEMRTVLNREAISTSVTELYASTKKEVMDYLSDNRTEYGSFSTMADFWTCKTTHDKSLGLRVYLVDNDWKFRSLLLGTRKFDPSYGDRDRGIQNPFRMWTRAVLDDFNLKRTDFYGATSDAGSDVKSKLAVKLGLSWEWCMAHMAHAATKAACGTSGRESLNPGMTDLIQDMKSTISLIKKSERMGDLFAVLTAMRSISKKGLKTYSAHRFLGISDAMERVLEHWSAIEEWFEARETKALREGQPPPEKFPLRSSKHEMVQVLSILKPIASLKRRCQAEQANQVDVLLLLYLTRMTTLGTGTELKHCESTEASPKWISPSEMTNLGRVTRRLVRDELDERFFRRYTDRDRASKASFVFELQLRLHPTYKSPETALNRIIRLCSREAGASQSTIDRNVDYINDIIRKKLRELMTAVAGPQVEPPPSPASDDYADELMAAFAPSSVRKTPPNLLENRVTEELDRWMDDSASLRRTSEAARETVLEFWKRMDSTGDYKFLPRVARMIFSVPASSAQLERDFGVSGNMVTSQRTSLSKGKIDMCSFINRNRAFVDITQCEKIPLDELAYSIPSNVLLPLDDTSGYDSDEMIINTMSAASIHDEERARLDISFFIKIVFAFEIGF
jgi:hypothetical protein